MKLIYLHQYFTFPQSSGGTRSYDLSKVFVNQGIDVTMVTTSANMKALDNPDKKRWVYIEKEGIKFWILNSDYDQKMSIPRRLIAFFEFLWFGTFKVLQLKGNIVLATSTPFTVAVPALIKKRLHKTPYIFEVRDVWPEGPIQLGYIKNKILIWLLHKYEKLIYKNAIKIVALSTGMRADIISRYKDIQNIEVIPNISEVNRFSDLNHKVDLNFDIQDKKVVLYAGTMGPVNNIIYVAKFAELLKEINRTDIVFLIVGDGNEKEKIQEYCINKELLNVNVFFIDKIPKNSLPHLYSVCAMGSSFVLDNKIKWDNSANKFFDTLAAGRPVLINHRGWQAELIETENLGYVLPAHPNIEDAQRFANYISDDTLLQQQRKNAKRVAKEQFSLEVASQKYLNILTQIYHG